MVDLCKSAKNRRKYELLFQIRIIIIGIVPAFWKRIEGHERKRVRWLQL